MWKMVHILEPNINLKKKIILLKMEFVETEFVVGEIATISIDTTDIFESVGLTNSDSIPQIQIRAICNSPRTRECLSKLIGLSRAAATIATSLNVSITSTWESAIQEWCRSREGFVPSIEFKDMMIE